MDVVNTIDDIRDNLSLFEKYLCEGTKEEQIFAYSLIQKGSCFIAYKVGVEIRFSPSRYIGYLKNTLLKHQNNLSKDGRETNLAIDKIVSSILTDNFDLEKEYITYAKNLGIKPYNKNRKYWLFDLELDKAKSTTSTSENFPEGKIVERSHKAKERNTKLVLEVKRKFLEENGSLYCDVCSFDFSNVYGERGEGYIEAHHLKPVCEMQPGEETNISDIALVCANCHRILHRSRPWLSVENLRKIMIKT